MRAELQLDDFACMQHDLCVQHACLLILHCSEERTVLQAIILAGTLTGNTKACTESNSRLY